MADTDTPTPDAPEAPATDAPAADAPAADAPAADAPLGEAGTKALEAFKARARSAEAENKALKDQIAAKELESMSEQERALTVAVNEAVERTRSEVLGTVQRDRFADKVAAVTAGKLTDQTLLADPDVATKLLGFDAIPVTETGQIDAEAISAAVDSFLAERPYLAAGGATPPAPLSQGARRNTDAPQTLAAQIATAEQAGDWKAAQRLKTVQLVELSRHS
jgi:hypothetical protein